MLATHIPSGQAALAYKLLFRTTNLFLRTVRQLARAIISNYTVQLKEEKNMLLRTTTTAIRLFAGKTMNDDGATTENERTNEHEGQ